MQRARKTGGRSGRQRRGVGAVLPVDSNLVALQSTWFELRDKAWNTIALVPSEERIHGLELAVALASVGCRFESREIVAMSGVASTLEESRGKMQEMLRLAQIGSRTIVAVAHPSTSPLAVPLIRAADAAVLLVALESTSIQEARDVVARIGEARFVGAVALQISKGARVSRSPRRGDKTVISDPTWADLASLSLAPAARTARKEGAT